jgi:peptidoglycan/xylan/chitin deacetylase (PgdA/CDA1 family)
MLRIAAFAAAAALATVTAAPAQEQAPAAAASAEAQAPAPAEAQAPAAAPVQAQAEPQAPAAAPACPGNPNAIGTSRVITIDPGQYRRLGTLQYPETLPLQDHEVVLTFDDGPLPPHTTNVLNVLSSQCVRALFFLVGEMAHAYPDIVKRIHADGHTIGTHSQDHPLRFDRISDEKVRWEIDQGVANVALALGEAGGLSQFFRIPGFGRTDYVEQAAAERSLMVFSTDVVADDWFRRIGPSQVIARAVKRLEEKGKGMLLLHDIHPWTAVALPGLLKELKDHGFRIVEVVPSATVPPMIAARPAWSVAWSMVDQTILDDGSARPSWPALQSDSAVAEAADLPAPDEGTFDPNYALAHAANVANANADSASVEAGIGTTPWPYQVAVALPAASTQLPAPSLADIGWPVKELPVAERESDPRVSTAKIDAAAVASRQGKQVEPVRHVEVRHVRFIVRRNAGARPAAGQHASLYSTTSSTPAY